MSAQRRVRVRFTTEQVGRILRPQRIALVDRLRVSSRCEGRPDIWEWRLAYARSLG